MAEEPSTELPKKETDENVSDEPKTEKVTRPQPSDKVIVLLRPAGSTPALSKAKWSVTRDKTVGSILGFVKRMLKMGLDKSLFLYVKQTFAPSADVEIGKLLDCFGSDGQLVLHYCATEAWG